MVTSQILSRTLLGMTLLGSSFGCREKHLPAIQPGDVSMGGNEEYKYVRVIYDRRETTEKLVVTRGVFPVVLREYILMNTETGSRGSFFEHYSADTNTISRPVDPPGTTNIVGPSISSGTIWTVDLENGSRALKWDHRNWSLPTQKDLQEVSEKER